MTLGPLEYMVIGVPPDQFMQEILPELSTLQESGLIRVVDLLYIGKAADGMVTEIAIDEMIVVPPVATSDGGEKLMGLFTPEDIDRLAHEIPANTSAAIVLLEHVWTLHMTDAVRRAGGIVFTGGVIHPDGVRAVSEELMVQEEMHA